MDLIFRDPEGRELTQDEAMDMVIVHVAIDDAANVITVSVKEQG